MIMNARRRVRQWRVVRGERIAGILFEIDPQMGIIRIKRGRESETVDLRKFGLQPAQHETKTEPPA